MSSHWMGRVPGKVSFRKGEKTRGYSCNTKAPQFCSVTRAIKLQDCEMLYSVLDHLGVFPL